MPFETFIGENRGRGKASLAFLKVGKTIFLNEPLSQKLKRNVMGIQRRYKMVFEWEEVDGGIRIRRRK